MQNFLFMLQFMTRYPIPLEIDFSVRRFVQGMKWMPLVGLMVGLPGAATLFLLEGLIGGEAATLFALIAAVGVTGGLHLDGIGDTADGLFSYRSRERILEIMRDSTLGTNGVTAIVLDILVKFVLVKNLPLAWGVIALLIAPVLGRMAITWHAVAAGYARAGEGMGEFVGQLRPGSAVFATFFSLLLCSVLFFLSGVSFLTGMVFLLLLHGAVILWALLFARYLQKRIGGITGDTIGTTIELSEIITFFIFLTGLKYLS